MAERKIDDELYGRFLVVSTDWDNDLLYNWFASQMEKCLKDPEEVLDWGRSMVDMARRREHDIKEADKIREEWKKKVPQMGPINKPG